MRRLVFTINTGRSGSRYLYKLLRTGKDVQAFHFDQPDMAGKNLITYPATRPTPFDSLYYLSVVYPYKYYTKIRAIKRTLRTLPPEGVYADTSHMFLLAFSDVVMRHFKRSVEVIVLRRYLPKIVKSMMQLNDFAPGHRSRIWRTSPNSKSAVAQALAPDEEMDRIDKIIGYLIDVEARAQQFRTKYPGTRLVEVRLEQLNDWDNVEKLFQDLRIGITEGTKTATGRVANTRGEEKQKFDVNISEEYCLRRIEDYIAKCEKKGIQLPRLPHLEPA